MRITDFLKELRKEGFQHIPVLDKNKEVTDVMILSTLNSLLQHK